MMRQKVVVETAILMTLLVSVSNAAIIDFDNLPPLTNVINQYKGNYGVSFSPSRIIKPSKATASGPQALQAGSVGIEYHPGPLVIYFDAGQSNVKVAVGLETKGIHMYDAILTAFDSKSGGKQIGTPVTTKVGPGPSPITKSMAISSTQANIWRVELIYKRNAKDESSLEVIDSLEFDTAVKPPPDNQVPVVKITKPKTGDVTQTAFFELQGTIQENAVLADVWLSIEQSGKPTVSYQITYYGSAPNFTFGGSMWMGLLYEGKNTVTVKATDISNNVGQDSVTVHYKKPPPPPPPTIDLFPRAMEITQGINRVIALSNPPGSQYALPYWGTPLVQEKRTVVRVYGGVNGAKGPVTNVLCELWGRRGGVDLPGSPLYTTPKRITLNPADNISTQRPNTNLTWNFVIPNTWTDKWDGVDLIAFVNPMQEMLEAPNGYNISNKMYVLGLHFHETSDLHIYPVPVCVRRSASVPQTTCDALTQQQMINVLTGNNSALPQLIPVADAGIQLNFRPTVNFDGNFSNPQGAMTSDRMKALLGHIKGLRQQAAGTIPIAVNRVFLGLFREPVTAWDGLAKMNYPAAIAKVDPANIWNDSLTVVEEVGHTFNRDHAPCGDPDSVDSGYPQYYGPGGVAYPKASIGQWGMDTRTLTLKNPASTYDFMSYCGPEWVSRYTYEKLYDRLKVGVTSAKSSPNRTILAHGVEQWEYLFVNGVIEPDGAARLQPFYRFPLPVGTSDEQGQGEYSLELLDAGENVLFTRYFDPVATMDGDDPSSSIQEIVPFAEGTVQVVLRHGEEVLDAKIASSHAPVVTVLSPNGDELWDDLDIESINWVAEDGDHDELYYTVQYSDDGGQNWETLGLNLTDSHLEVDDTEIPGSNSALIRVVATDGFNVGSDDSDWTFTVTGKPPIVRMISPADGDSYMQGQIVPLQGLGTDVEDGPLADESFTWESHRDGILGTGKRLDAFDLSPGVHEITLICQDSEGNFATDAVTIEIVALPLQIEILNLEAKTICNPGFSHTIQFGWNVNSSGASPLVVGPLSLAGPDGKMLRFEGPLPSGDTLIMPVNFPAGGLLQIRLDVSDNTGMKAFAQQSVTLPPCCKAVVDFGLAGIDIGEPLPAGTISYSDDGTPNITAGGADIWDNADQFYYAYKADEDTGEPVYVFGDFTAIVGVRSMEPNETAHEWAKAGIMARQDPEPGSPHTMVIRSLRNGADLQGRDLHDQESWRIPMGDDYGPDQTVWLRLDRVGNTFTGSYFVGGETPPTIWIASSSHESPLPADVLLGLATTSHQQERAIMVEYLDFCIGPYAGPAVLLEPKLLPWPPCGEGYIGIREVIDNGEIGDQGVCYDSLSSNTGTIVEYTAPVLNIQDSDGNGNYGNDDVFGVVTEGRRDHGDVDDISLIARGIIHLPEVEEGSYTFGVNSDDGFTLQFPGHDFISAVNGEIVNFESGAALRFYGSRAAGDTLGVINLSPGDHPFWLTFHERAGGAAVELYAAEGVHTAFDLDVFRLVGHKSIGSFPVPGFCDEVIMKASLPGAWGEIDSVQDAMEVVAEGEAFGTNSIRGCVVVNHSDPDDGADDPDLSGSFGADLVFPNDRPGNDDDFGVMVEGLLDIPVAGTYQIGFNSDDGAGFQIFGHQWKSIVPGSDATAVIVGDIGDWLITDALTGWSWTAGEIEFPAPGCYEFRAIMFERGGGSFFELFGRGISVTGVPDPTWHLLNVGGAGVFKDFDGLQLAECPSAKPECWSYPRQCHGDADGKSQGKKKYWVGSNDLDVLIAAWNKPFAEIKGRDFKGTALICADFDHLPQGKKKYRVSINDLDILIANWNKANAPAPNCP
jgi:hypothetical protein